MSDATPTVLAASAAAASGLPHIETPVPYDAILLAGFGGPEGQDDVIPFLRNVTRGRGIPDERLEEVAHHYRHFGGVSPINAQNRALKAAIEAELAARGIDLPVYWGNRNWAPFLEEAVQDAADDGGTTLLAIATSAYSSYSSCRQYREDFARVLDATALGGTVTIDKVRQFFDHPGFVSAFTEGVTDAVRTLIGEGIAGERIRVLFSTHSIPTADAQRSGPRDRDFGAGGAYAAQHEAVAAFVMAQVVAASPEAAAVEWELVYQSRSGPPTQPWLEPDVCDVIGELPGRGAEAVVIVPLGFVSDHMEVLWDLDTEAMEAAAGGRHPRGPHTDTGHRSGVRERPGRPRGGAPQRHSGSRSPPPHRPGTMVRRVPSGVLRERPGRIQAGCLGGRPMTSVFKPGAPIRVGTRASALAVAQTSAIASLLGAHELVTITSEGDRSSAPLPSIGGTGVFVSALRDALLAGEVDVIVHSFKDLPTAPADGITLAAVPVRADARDALVTRDGVTLAKLPRGARVGTGSPRRRAQLLAARPDLDVVGIRGNVDTRLGSPVRP